MSEPRATIEGTRMGHWGVKSFENDEAADALDAGMDRVHGSTYDELMDDGNPLGVDEIHRRLADARTLGAAVEALIGDHGSDLDAWGDEARLAYAGVVVRHVELGVGVDEATRERAAGWLEGEEIEWDEATARRLRKQREIGLLRRGPSAGG